jgi:putative transport protein
MYDVLGEKADGPVIINADMDRRTLVVTNRDFAGKTFAELRILRKHGVSVSRIKRNGYEFIPDDHTEVLLGDQFVTVGNAENLNAFADLVGHRPASIGATDLLSLSLGMALGVWVGSIPIGGFKLGLAGGPLLVALLLGHFGRIGVIAGYVPRPTRQLLGELGLCFFLAGAGIKGGSCFVETLQAQGGGIFAVGIIATMTPIIVGYMIAVLLFKFDILTSLGGVCGAMTSTPALGAISSKTDAQAPILSYASAYPAALLLIVLVVNMLLQIMDLFSG